MQVDWQFFFHQLLAATHCEAMRISADACFQRATAQFLRFCVSAMVSPGLGRQVQAARIGTDALALGRATGRSFLTWRRTYGAADLMSQKHASPEEEAIDIARATARTMWDDDKASQALGIKLIEIGPGQAVMSMAIRVDMANGHGMCHGGFIFLLADSAFAFACNSHNQRAVAAGAEIHFVAPAKIGDVLTARASEQHRAGRSGFYDVNVTDQHGDLIALFRGRSATIKGQLVDDSAVTVTSAQATSTSARNEQP